MTLEDIMRKEFLRSHRSPARIDAAIKMIRFLAPGWLERKVPKSREAYYTAKMREYRNATPAERLQMNHKIRLFFSANNIKN